MPLEAHSGHITFSTRRDILKKTLPVVAAATCVHGAGAVRASHTEPNLSNIPKKEIESIPRKPSHEIPLTKIMIAMIEKRRRVIYVNIQDLKLILQWIQQPEDAMMRLPIHEDIPEDVHIGNVFMDYPRNALGIILYHPSYEEVLIGDVPKEIESIGCRTFVKTTDGSHRSRQV